MASTTPFGDLAWSSTTSAMMLSIVDSYVEAIEQGWAA